MQISLGSSLLAKSNPGGKLRDLAEANAAQPNLPGKGAIGSVDRAQVEQPLDRQISPGSDKVVSVSPTLEGGNPTDNLFGLTPGNMPLRSGAAGQPLLAPGTPLPGGEASVANLAASSPRYAKAYEPPPPPVEQPQQAQPSSAPAQNGQPSQPNQPQQAQPATPAQQVKASAPLIRSVLGASTAGKTGTKAIVKTPTKNNLRSAGRFIA